MIRDLLERSRATDEFREALESFLRTGRSAGAVTFDAGSPPVKVERTIAKALEEYPGLPIEAIEIRGISGCEFYRGVATITAGGEARVVRFVWDCKWKAQEMGWTDYFGFPDQGRAAREFGHACFRTWDEEKRLRVQMASEGEPELAAV